MAASNRNKYVDFIKTMNLTDPGTRARIFSRRNLTDDMHAEFELSNALVEELSASIEKHFAQFNFSSIPLLQNIYKKAATKLMVNLNADKSWQETIPSSEVEICSKDLCKAYVFRILSVCVQERFVISLGKETAALLQMFLHEVNRRSFNSATYDEITQQWEMPAPAEVESEIQQAALQQSQYETPDKEYILFNFVFSNISAWSMIYRLSWLLGQLNIIQQMLINLKKDEKHIEIISNHLANVTNLLEQLRECVYQVKDWKTHEYPFNKLFSKIHKELDEDALLKNILADFDKLMELGPEKSAKRQRSRSTNKKDDAISVGKSDATQSDDPVIAELKAVLAALPPEVTREYDLRDDKVHTQEESTSPQLRRHANVPKLMFKSATTTSSPPLSPLTSPRIFDPSEEAKMAIESQYRRNGIGLSARLFKIQERVEAEATLSKFIQATCDQIKELKPDLFSKSRARSRSFGDNRLHSSIITKPNNR